MQRTNIEYLTHTWSPIAMRCTPVSEGCLNCWHLRMADRMAANPAFPDDVRAAYAGEGPPVLIEKRLEEPMRRRKPSVIGVQFMGDLWHEQVPDEIRHDIFSVMAFCQQHTFVTLTKRAREMFDWFIHPAVRRRRWPMEGSLWAMQLGKTFELPLPNVIGMVTAENQHCADERIGLLLGCPFVLRGVSVEPMLERLYVWDYLPKYDYRPMYAFYQAAFPEAGDQPILLQEGLDWVACGFETGPKARPGDFAWARSLRDECEEASTPFFWKRAAPGQETPEDLMVREFPHMGKEES